MEARTVHAIPRAGGYLFEPKWDGFRALAFCDGKEVELQSKSGQPLARYFPEIVAALRRMDVPQCVLDGELVVPVEDQLDFDQLLQRIHPAASRVEKLAAEFPARFMVFDLLVDDAGERLFENPLHGRRTALERFATANFAHALSLQLSPATTDAEIAERWLSAGGTFLDGVVAKRLQAPYASGDRSAMVKIKRLRTADCVIGGYRTSPDGSLGSLLLGLYDSSGALDYVGFTSGLSSSEKARTLRRLEALRAPSAFGARSPGGPSRWNRGKEAAWVPVAPELVIEVEFDHVSNGRFRHGTKPLRFRPDKCARVCSAEQLVKPGADMPGAFAGI